MTYNVFASKSLRPFLLNEKSQNAPPKHIIELTDSDDEVKESTISQRMSKRKNGRRKSQRTSYKEQSDDEFFDAADQSSEETSIPQLSAAELGEAHAKKVRCK